MPQRQLVEHASRAVVAVDSDHRRHVDEEIVVRDRHALGVRGRAGREHDVGERVRRDVVRQPVRLRQARDQLVIVEGIRPPARQPAAEQGPAAGAAPHPQHETASADHGVDRQLIEEVGVADDPGRIGDAGQPLDVPRRHRRFEDHRGDSVAQQGEEQADHLVLVPAEEQHARAAQRLALAQEGRQAPDAIEQLAIGEGRGADHERLRPVDLRLYAVVGGDVARRALRRPHGQGARSRVASCRPCGCRSAGGRRLRRSAAAPCVPQERSAASAAGGSRARSVVRLPGVPG